MKPVLYVLLGKQGKTDGSTTVAKGDTKRTLFPTPSEEKSATEMQPSVRESQKHVEKKAEEEQNVDSAALMEGS